ESPARGGSSACGWFEYRCFRYGRIRYRRLWYRTGRCRALTGAGNEFAHAQDSGIQEACPEIPIRRKARSERSDLERDRIGNLSLMDSQSRLFTYSNCAASRAFSTGDIWKKTRRTVLTYAPSFEERLKSS